MASSSKKAADRAAKLAAARAEQQRKERRRRLLSIAGVAAAMILIIGGAVWYSVHQKHQQDEQLTRAAAKPSAYGLTIGPSSADHRVVIYEDFLCPFCGQLEDATHEKLEQLASEGKVQVEYRPFDLLHSGHIVKSDYPFHALNAFFVVEQAAGAKVAKKFHDLLYAHQPDEKGPYLTDDDLVKYAVQAGAQEDQVRDGIENVTQRDKASAANSAAYRATVTSTPTVLLDGKRLDGSVSQMVSQLWAAVE